MDLKAYAEQAGKDRSTLARKVMAWRVLDVCHVAHKKKATDALMENRYGNAAEVEARRKGDAGEVIQFLREQSVINDGLLDTDTNRTLHIAEIHNTRKTACFRDGRCEVRRFSATFPHNRRKYRLKMGRQKSE